MRRRDVSNGIERCACREQMDLAKGLEKSRAAGERCSSRGRRSPRLAAVRRIVVKSKSRRDRPSGWWQLTRPAGPNSYAHPCRTDPRSKCRRPARRPAGRRAPGLTGTRHAVRSVRLHDVVDDVDDAVRLHDVGDRDAAGVALGVLDREVLVADALDPQRLAVDRLQLGLAAHLVDHVPQILRRQLPGTTW